MALELYRKKRNFRITPEPAGRTHRHRSRDLAFVIQKHQASHLHYDFRLELDGVLLSWAVPKGPSLDPRDKRLAMHVEDHPIEYGDFEGVIPPKQYGAGTVVLWDRGTWVPKEDPREGYRKGRLKFELDGEKLQGAWILVKSHGGKYGGDKSWLLIKENDAFARPASDGTIVDERPESVLTGRTLEAIAQDPDRTWHSDKSVAENVKHGAVKKRKPRLDLASVAGARKAPLRGFVEPQLATLVDEAPDGDEWLHEIKYDGYRMLCRIERGACAMLSRNGKEWTASFPRIAEALARLPVQSAWIDGEVVAADVDGRTSFQALQNAMSNPASTKLAYYAFDMPYLDGYDLADVPLVERKRLLQSLIGEDSALVRFSTHFAGGGPNVLAEACRLGIEGIVSKLADSPYRSTRARSWLKVKCEQRQEFVIGGYTDPKGARSGFGALLLGVYQSDGKLRYCGKVGTGFDEALLADLTAKLKKLETSKPAFVNPPAGAEARRSHWVEPKLVGEVSFTEWTNDGTLRHPSFQGLREDKRARDVVREKPMDTQAADAPADAAPSSATKKRAPTKRANNASGADTVAGVHISNATKTMYAEAGLAKIDLARYYEAVGDAMLPHLRGRPLTLVRCPNGWQKCFYWKHATARDMAPLDQVMIEEDGGPKPYMVANSVAAIVALLQTGVLELHPWGSRVDDLGRPDRIVFDFDPDERIEWPRLVESVNVLRTLLDELGLTGFLKTTGGKGLHVVVPIRPTLGWDAIKGFTKSVAELLVHTFPDRFVATVSKRSREGKIFVDYLRNAEGATAVAPYSLRAKANAPVAMPIGWDDLERDVRFDHFNAKNVPSLLAKRRRDPWQRLFETRQSITSAMMRNVGA
jgi:bifunctional non-homologous end joining protein LigD